MVNERALIDRMGFKQSSPRYEITNKDTKFEVDVPGVKLADIHVSVEHDNSILSIAGVREAS